MHRLMQRLGHPFSKKKEWQIAMAGRMAGSGGCHPGGINDGYPQF
jgi:hypothetical protein